MSVPTFEYTLPTTKAVITFKEPKTADRRAVLGMMQPTDKTGVDELLAAYCIVAVNGNPPTDRDFRFRTDPLPLIDTQAYVELFLSMFTLNQAQVTEIHALAKKLRGIDTETSSESTLAQS